MAISQKKATIKGNKVVFEDIDVFQYKIDFYNNTGDICLYKLDKKSNLLNDFTSCSDTIKIDIENHFNALLDIVSEYYFMLEEKEEKSEIINKFNSFATLFINEIGEKQRGLNIDLCQEFSIIISILNDYNDLSLYEYEKLIAFNHFNINYEREPFVDYEQYEPNWAVKEYTNDIEYANLCYEDSKVFLNDNSDIFINVDRYTCTSISEMILAFLHYFKLNKYKLAFCKHCEKVFFTKTLKKNYCDRNSPLKGYEDKDCYKARKTAWNALLKRKTTLDARLKNHTKYREEFDFDEKLGKYESNISDNPTPKNLQAYYDFLYYDCETIYKKYERVNKYK